MDMDTKMKRASFISSSTDIRNMFSFALPSQVLNSVNFYSAHFSGAMLCDLYGDMAGQVYRCWNTCVKLVWDVPRSTHNYFVEHLLAKDWVSVRERLLVQYVKFLQKSPKSISAEVRILQNIVKNYVRPVAGKNCLKLSQEFSLDPLEQDDWRIPLLNTLLTQRYEMSACGEDLEIVSGLIESLCSS